MSHLNVRNFRDVMAGIVRLLDPCSAGISVYLDELRDSRRYEAFE
jgi:hypothetical protein